MKLLILKGLPASGKTTWAREYTEQHEDWIRVNRDDLRNMRGKYWIPKQEKLITDWENQCIYSALSKGYNVILDATNLNDERNKTKIKVLQASYPKLKVETKFFDTKLKVCLQRDYARRSLGTSVGKDVIQKMYDKYLAPPPIIYYEDKSLPHCVIFDVDGTLAKMDGRQPYDWDRVKEDKPNLPIVNLCRDINRCESEIIIFTGRDGVCLPDTKEWLRDNHISYKEIYIRPEGNTEKDTIIKKRMFHDHIKGKYYVDFIVDDRDSVVEMWRKELGITCLQVDYGNF